MNKWGLDTSTFSYRIRVKDKCVLTDAIGYEHFHSTQRFCTLFEIPYLLEIVLETLVESDQAIWVELTLEELQEFKNERPWWQRWLHDLLLWVSKGSKG